MNDPSGGGPDDPLPDPFAESEFELLRHPQRPLEPRYGVQLREELFTARVVAVKREHDEPQHQPRGKPEDQHGADEPGPRQCLEGFEHHANLRLVTEGASLGAWTARAPSSCLPWSVSR